MNYYHNDEECFCYECGNNSLYLNTEMCKLCYDDNNLVYFCYLCNGYYNYLEINKVCSKYIISANIIKNYWITYKKN